METEKITPDERPPFAVRTMAVACGAGFVADIVARDGVTIIATVHAGERIARCFAAAPNMAQVLSDLLLIARMDRATDAELYDLDERYGTENSNWAETVQEVYDQATALLKTAGQPR